MRIRYPACAERIRIAVARYRLGLVHSLEIVLAADHLGAIALHVFGPLRLEQHIREGRPRLNLANDLTGRSGLDIALDRDTVDHAGEAEGAAVAGGRPKRRRPDH